MGTVGGLLARPGPGLSWGSREGGGDPVAKVAFSPTWAFFLYLDCRFLRSGLCCCLQQI